MPKIPIYERQVARTSEADAAYSLAGERLSALTIPSHRAEYVGQVAFSERVTRIGERLMEADRVQQFSQAIVSANDGISRTLYDMQKDPALIDAPPEEYEKELGRRANALKGDIQGKIRDVRTKEAFGLRFDDKVVDATNKVRALGRDRMISRGRATTDAQLDSLVNSFITSGDPKVLAEGGSIIAAKRAAGFFTAEEAEQLGQKFSRQASVNYWQRQILNAPAMAYTALQQNPESFGQLPEADRTTLMANAKQAADKWGRDQVRNGAYDMLKNRFGRNNDQAIDYLEDPKNMPNMDLDDRRYLIATFDAEISRDRERMNHARAETARGERRQVVDLLKKGEYDKAVELAGNSENLPGEFVEHVYRVAKKGSDADVTDPKIRTSLVIGIHRGQITTAEQIDRYRLQGLSNDDADSLTAKVEKPEKRTYKETLDYAEAKFKALYPAKTEKEKHLKWFEFVNHVDQELGAAEHDKGRRLTYEEGRKIVDAWIDPQIREIDWWFDKKQVPFFERPSTQAKPQPEIKKIPPEHVKTIERYLLRNGYKATPENIQTYYNNNPYEFIEAEH